eukprot:153404-Alexandrium_andersonii.AAC.1
MHLRRVQVKDGGVGGGWGAKHRQAEVCKGTVALRCRASAPPVGRGWLRVPDGAGISRSPRQLPVSAPGAHSPGRPPVGAGPPPH